MSDDIQTTAAEAPKPALETFTLKTITARDFFTTDEGDRVNVLASRTLNSIGCHWITLKIGRDVEVNFNYGGEEIPSLVAVRAVIDVLSKILVADLELPR